MVAVEASLAVQQSLPERLLLVYAIKFGCSKRVFEELANFFFSEGLLRYYTLSFHFRR